MPDCTAAPAPIIAPTRPAALPILGFAWAAVTLLIFAGWFVVTRFSVTHNLRIWDVTAMRFGVGILVLCPALRGLPPGAWRSGSP